MKKLIFVTVLILFAGLSFGQNLQKGNVVGFHNGILTPNPDVTMNQCVDFMKSKFFPAVEKAMPGVKCYVLRGVRGDNIDGISFIYVFTSDEIRNKYWKGDSAYTDLGNEAMKLIEPVNQEMTKYGKLADKYTDWMVL